MSENLCTPFFQIEQWDIYHWINGSRLLLDRAVRLYTPDLNYPACGFYRRMLQHADCPQATQEIQVMKEVLLDEIPKMTGVAAPEARSDNSLETYIMPPDDHLWAWESNPMISGKLILSMLILREESDARYANINRGTFFICHLYNALSQLGLLIARWSALQHITDLYPEPLFSSSRPTTARNMLTRFMLTTGSSMAPGQARSQRR